MVTKPSSIRDPSDQTTSNYLRETLNENITKNMIEPKEAKLLHCLKVNQMNKQISTPRSDLLYLKRR